MNDRDWSQAHGDGTDDEQLLQRLSIDPKLMTGRPVIRGTRLTDACTPGVARWLRDQKHEVLSVYDDARGLEDDARIRSHRSFVRGETGAKLQEDPPFTDMERGIEWRGRGICARRAPLGGYGEVGGCPMVVATAKQQRAALRNPPFEPAAFVETLRRQGLPGVAPFLMDELDLI